MLLMSLPHHSLLVMLNRAKCFKAPTVNHIYFIFSLKKKGKSPSSIWDPALWLPSCVILSPSCVTSISVHVLFKLQLPCDTEMMFTNQWEKQEQHLFLHYYTVPLSTAYLRCSATSWGNLHATFVFDRSPERTFTPFMNAPSRWHNNGKKPRELRRRSNSGAHCDCLVFYPALSLSVLSVYCGMMFGIYW